MLQEAKEGAGGAAESKEGGPPTAAQFIRFGASIELLHHIIVVFGVTADMTTSDVCHKLLKPATTPEGWEDLATLTNAEKRWYDHRYRNTSTGETRDDAPPGTRSYCAAALCHAMTADWVGQPTHFVSHAWKYKFVEVVRALRAFADAQDGGGAPMFFWFDCLSIDEHATQALSQEWWGTTFKDAIGEIGHTVMVLAPWDAPEPLTRAWCLWEVYCSVDTGAEFGVALGPEERERFEAGLLEDSGVLLDAFAAIDVADAEAGNPADRDMILDAVRATEGGTSGLNALVMAQMRRWVRGVVGKMVASGDLRTKLQVANLLQNLGDTADARALFEEVIGGYTVQLGPEHTRTLLAKYNLHCLIASSHPEEARLLAVECAAGFAQQLGPDHRYTRMAERAVIRIALTG